VHSEGKTVGLGSTSRALARCMLTDNAHHALPRVLLDFTRLPSVAAQVTAGARTFNANDAVMIVGRDGMRPRLALHPR
jgi:hypothetical protein